jgi:asparagine synthase (glutamine-hydrolysing)
MCGIAGYFGSNGNPNKVDLMLKHLNHRGPDDSQRTTGQNFCLGATRLSILDISNGYQPYTDAKVQVTAVLNGQIYNSLKIREELTDHGLAPASHCDTHVIPAAFRLHGKQLANELDGMFAISLWDEVSETGVLIRDPLGKKPLYYVIEDGTLYFASEIAALLSSLPKKYSVDDTCIYHYLSLRHVPRPHTGFYGVKELDPGSTLEFNYKSGEVTIDRFWVPKIGASRSHQDEQIVDQLEELLVDAVEKRLRADVPIAFTLSGGLDSSLALALAVRHQLVADPVAYTLSYEQSELTEGKSEDSQSARVIAEMLDVEHREVVIGTSDIFQNFENVIRSFCQPFVGTMSLWFLAKEISKDFKVVIASDGADEIFGSYLTHRLAYEKEVANKSAGSHLVSDLAWRQANFVFTDDEKLRLLTKKYLEKCSVNTGDFLEEYAPINFMDGELLNGLLVAELVSIFPDQVLKYADRLSMAHSLEIREPYLDRRFIEFVLSISGQTKMKNGQTKWPLKKLAERYLPYEIVHRPKEGFVMPFHAWVPQLLIPMCEKYLVREEIEQSQIFCWSEVETLVNGLNGKETVDYREANKVLAIIAAQVWLENSKI